MINAIIPARGGSKGVPGKNRRDFAGKPLIAWSIEDAQQSKYVSSVYVSTEDDEIAKISSDYGAEVIRRPLAFAQDTSSSESALLHALDEMVKKQGEPELILFLQATCPFRSGWEIDEAIELLQQSNSDSLLSVSPSHTFLWKEEGGEGVALNYDVSNRPRRQDFEAQFRENGSFYLFKPSILRRYNNRLGGKVRLYKMSEEAGVDIDTEMDFKMAEFIMRTTQEMKE